LLAGLLDQDTVPLAVGPRLLMVATQLAAKPTVPETGKHDTETRSEKSVPTVSATGAETTVAAGLELSVTWSSKFQVPGVVRFPVEADGEEAGVQPPTKRVPRALNPLADGDFFSHWHVYGEEPPEKGVVVESMPASPLLTVVGETEIVGGASEEIPVAAGANRSSDTPDNTNVSKTKRDRPTRDRDFNSMK